MQKLAAILMPALWLCACGASHRDSDDAGVEPDSGRGCAASDPRCDCLASDRVPAHLGPHGFGDPISCAESFRGECLEAPAHYSDLQYSFYMGRFEVTAGCFHACVAAGGCAPQTDEARREVDSRELGAGSDDVGPAFLSSEWYRDPDLRFLPMAGVGVRDGREYCAWLGGRLPSGREWERAARGEDGRLFPWTEGPADRSVSGLCGEANFPFCDGGSFQEVGRHRPGPFGAYDLLGNVAEWTSDGYVIPEDALYPVEPDEVVPMPFPFSPSGEPWVEVRGARMPSTYRGLATSTENLGFSARGVGFRCVFMSAPAGTVSSL